VRDVEGGFDINTVAGSLFLNTEIRLKSGALTAS
jgi:hypothetical protein